MLGRWHSSVYERGRYVSAKLTLRRSAIDPERHRPRQVEIQDRAFNDPKFSDRPSVYMQL